MKLSSTVSYAALKNAAAGIAAISTRKSAAAHPYDTWTGSAIGEMPFARRRRIVVKAHAAAKPANAMTTPRQPGTRANATAATPAIARLAPIAPVHVHRRLAAHGES